ncbi:metallophosphoesterase family protein [Paenibacillus ehimensis]|uniref:metallophosphoesterase family protein n=1 Tax=Paenibacillus ehimensis TaxID=79264 RepID=UPI000472A880|nr:metallophosphoesterase [Paenibacillus ehimensis]MEC0210312.1 metallophosphoesterase [Paenibacillus ehimensis]
MLRIESLGADPVERFAYRTATGSGGIAEVQLPVYVGQMTSLPSSVDALIVTSDLQGMMRTADGKDVMLGERLPDDLSVLIGIEWPDIAPDRVGVLLCGDLYGDLRRGGSGDPTGVWLAFGETFRWVVGVAGNHDLMADAEKRELSRRNICLIDRPGIAEFGGAAWGGLGGVIGRPDKPNRMAEADYLQALRKLLHKQPHALLLHQSPDVPERGCAGSPEIRAVLESGPEALVFCGHSHWNDPLACLPGGTQVLNVDAKVCIFTR